MTRLVLLSDTHGHHDRLELPPGDVLVHAGDFCTSGKELQARAFAKWLQKQPFDHKIVVAGNHDRCLELRAELAAELFEGATYLLDRGATVAGLRFYGSPWQPEFLSWSYNLPRGPALAEVWAAVPANIDVLVTHGPPAHVLDRTFAGLEVGCEDLERELSRIRPRLHVFGHIHEAAGTLVRDGTLFVNASICGLDYVPRNPIRVVDVASEGEGPATLVDV